LIIDKDLTVTVGNQTCHFVNGKSLKIKSAISVSFDQIGEVAKPPIAGSNPELPILILMNL